MESTEAPVWAERFWAKVRKNETTGCHEWTGAPMRVGYGSFNFAGRRYYAHRFAWEQARGPIPRGVLIDHLCHNKLCVNVDHLRLASRKENAENLSGMVATNTSGYRGVTFCKQTRRWRAQIMHHKRMIHIGRFDTPEDAALAAAAKRAELFTPIPEVGNAA